jgi:hypothetical protein
MHLILLLLFLAFLALTSVNNSLASSSGSTGSGCYCLLGLLRLLLDSLLFIILVNSCFSLSKLLLYFFYGGNIIVGVPGVGLDLSHGKSVGWVKLEHGSNEVLEVITEEGSTVGLIVRVCFPEDIGTVSADELIEGITGLTSSEGWMLREHDKEDDGGSK